MVIELREFNKKKKGKIIVLANIEEIFGIQLSFIMYFAVKL